MADLIQPPPAHSAMTDSQGLATRPWLVWLQQLPSAVKVVVSSIGGALVAALNLSDLADKSAARTNLGLGTAALHAVSDFDPAGAAASAVSAFSATLGSAATQSATAFDAAGAAAAALATSLQKANNLSDLANPATARTNLGLGAGTTGSITLAKLTTTGANGSIAVVNGVITAFVNPT